MSAVYMAFVITAQNSERHITGLDFEPERTGLNWLA